MITKYLFEAMHRARYKIVEDGSYYGWIEELPGAPGVSYGLELPRKPVPFPDSMWKPPVVLGLLSNRLPLKQPLIRFYST
jgi:hypothetical protein